MCSICGKSAPVIFDTKGGRCSACGAPQPFLRGALLPLAGEHQRMGGRIAAWLGWLIFLGGFSFSAFFGWVGTFLFESWMLAKYISLPVAILSLLLGSLVLFAGRSLEQRGVRAQRDARVAALQSAAFAYGGAISVAQAAAALQLPEAQADALLTELAIAQEVQQELTDQGELLYSFSQLRIARTPSQRFDPPPQKRVTPPSSQRVAPTTSEPVAKETIEELEAVLEPPSRHKSSR